MMVVDVRISQTTDDWPIFPDNTDLATQTLGSFVTTLANSFESGLVGIPHWPMSVWEETLIISS